MAGIYDFTATSLAGDEVPLKRFEGQVLLIVNTASACGFTPQYQGLEALHQAFSPRGFSVLGFPCNQFGGQEPGTAEEISTFCSATYGVTFPLSGKIEVNGPGRDAVYGVLTETPDAAGDAGDIQWNFEKFVVSADGRVLGRFRPRTEPDASEVRDCIQRTLDAS